MANQTSMPIRFSVSGYSWSQSPTDPLILKPAHELIFFPSIFSLLPMQIRHIRIGTTANATDRETAYRIIVEELPALSEVLRRPAAGAQLTLRTRVSLPLFEESTAERSFEATFADPQVRGNALSIAVKNDGNTHLQIPKITLLAQGFRGEVVFSATTVGWYVLPGSVRRFFFHIPGNRCSEMRRLSFHADGTRPFHKTFDWSAVVACPR